MRRTTATPKPKRGRSPNFPPAFRAAALAALDANGGNVKRTARELGLKWQTLDGWRRGRRDPVPDELRTQKTVDLLASAERLADALAGGIAGKVAAGEADVKDMAVAFGITVDKLLLLRGQATAITKSQTAATTFDITRLTRDELLALAALQDKANGVPELPQASDLSNPVCVDDPTEAPEGEQPRS